MRPIPLALSLLSAVIGLAACSSKESTLVRPAGIEEQQAVVPKRQLQVSPLRRKVLAQLEKKNYRQALELMNGKYHEGLEREYVAALNGLLEVGDGVLSQGDYAAAGHAFKVVQNAYPSEPPLRERISHDPKRIRTCLELCVNRLMEQGLQEYRCGRLESAIRKWKTLLAINPGHHEAKKALSTATVQLQALQNLKNM